ANIEIEMIGAQEPKLPAGTMMMTGFERSTLGETLKAHGALVTADFFEVMGVRPLLGRTFGTADDEAADQSIVLGHDLWRRRFAADETIVGRAITLNGESYTVIAVMPAGFEFPKRVGLWQRKVFTPRQLVARSTVYLRVIGRLKPGVAIQQAQSEMDAIAKRLEQAYPDANADGGINTVPLLEQTVGRVKPALIAAVCATGFVLLLACANVANLLLMRGAARRREFAIRAALGAGRGRLLRQQLVESLILALLGGGAGIILAIWCVDALIAIGPSNLPRLDTAHVDAAVIGFALLSAIAAGVLCGIVPALQPIYKGLVASLKEGGVRSTLSRGRRRVQSGLVVTELALVVVLLVGAGLMIQTVARLQGVDKGFDATDVWSAMVVLPKSSYSTTARQTAFFGEVLEWLESTPGVRAASLATTVPLSGDQYAWEFSIEGRPDSPAGTGNAANWDAVTPDYFRAMGIRLIKGRTFTPLDHAAAPPVVVISQSMARRFWPDENPLGQRIRIDEDAPLGMEIVGVVGDITHWSLSSEVEPHMYAPFDQDPQRTMNIVVRAEPGSAGMTRVLREAVRHVDAAQPTSAVRAMEYYVDKSTAQTRFTMSLLAAFAALGLVLAGVGTYGVTAHSVAQRTQEIGVRMALGAQRSDVLRLVLRQGLTLSVIGVGIGLIASIASARVVSELLYGISATDPATLAGVAVLLGLVSLAACYIPARRAARVDPMTALRCE
ncbi:MAG: ABC transporter permease, partial [Planctomycetes bacterium]|nr:ABC transporter permease [Planctomycetota bacterium]